MKKFTKLLSLLFFLQVVWSSSIYGQVYSNDFATGIDLTSPGPGNLFSTVWASSNPMTNPGGELLSKGFSTGSGTLTLTIKVKCGYELDISSIALKHRRDISGPQNMNLIVGGTTVQSAIAVTVSGPPSLTPLGSPYNTSGIPAAQDIIGQVLITLDLVNASNTGEYYLDDFVITGTVTPRVDVLTATILSPTVCEGSPANFTGTFTPTGVTGPNPSVAAVTPAYQWEKNAVNAPGVSTNLNYAIASTVSPADSGAYRLGLRFTGCAAGTPTEFYTTPAINLVVNKVTAAITPTTASVCVGSTTTLTGTNTVVATANPVPTEVWTTSNGNATVSTTGVVTGVTAGTSVITYTVTDNNNCSSSSTATITINAQPVPTITGTASVCVGSTTTLTGAPGLVSPATLTSGVWSTSASGVATVGTTGIVTGVSSGTSVIAYTVTDSNGCSSSTSVTVTVNPLPVPTITGVTPVCVGSTMAPTYTNGVVSPSIFASQSWTTSAAGIATVNTSNGVITGVSSGTSVITYTVVDNQGCSSSTTTTVTVNPLPTISFTNNGVPPGQVCIGNTITINGNATGLGLTHSWSVTSGTGFASGASTTGSIVLTGTTAGTVTVVYTVTSGASCSTSSSMVVTVNGLPANPTITGSLSICEGSSTLLTGSAPTGSVGPYFTDWTGSGPANVTPTYGITTANIVSNVPAVTPSAGYLVGYSVSDGNGCVNAVPASATVTVFAKPSAASISAGNQTLCNTSTFTVTGNTPSVGLGTWTVTGGVVTSSTSPTTTITGVTAGTTATATWTITNGTCGATSSNIASVTLTNNVMPTISASASGPNCNIGTFNISSTANVGTGVWTTTAGTVTNTTSTSTTVTGVPAGSTATLTWTVTNGSCTTSSTATVTNNAPPSAAVITTTPQKQCGAGVFVVNATVPAVGTGTWLVVGGTAQTPSSATTFVTGVAPGTVATATWTVSTGLGCPSTSASVTLTNYQAPTGVDAGPVSLSNCNNGTFNLTGTHTALTGVTDLSYSWTTTGGTASPTNTLSTVISGVPAGSSATATFSVTNGVCTVVSDQVVLNNYAQPTASVGSNVTVCNQTTDFTVTGTATPATPTLGVYTYVWSVTGGTITSASTGTSITVTVAPGSSATATWTVTNGSCSTSSFMTITNNAPVTSSITPVADQCNNPVFSLTANNPSPGTGVWTVVGGSASPTNSSSTTVSGVAPGTSATATWTVTNGTCTASSSVTFTNVGAPTASITTPSSIKCNEAGPFIVQAGALTFGTGVWTVTNGTINGSTTGTSVSVSVTPGASATTATVTWTVTNGICGSSSSAITIENRPALTATIVPNPANPTEMCPGTTINLQATPNGGPGRIYASQSFVGGPGSGSTFIVNFNTNPITNPNRLASVNGVAPQNPVTLTYTIIDNAGCTFSTQFVTKVNPSISVTVPATNVCVGNTATVTPVITGGSGTYSTFSWTATGNATASGTASTFVVTGVTAGTANVVFSVTDNQTCPASGTAVGVITVNPLPVLVNASQTNVSCFGGSNGAVTFTGATTYSISPVVGTQGSAGVFTGLTAGTYTVVGTSGFGCTSSTSVTITEPTQLVATATAPAILCNGGTTIVTVSATGGTGAYLGTGTFTVSAGTYIYTVVDANNCSASTSIIIAQPAAVVATISPSTNVSCFGGNNGSATVAGSGGTPGFTYAWSTSPVQNTTTATGLIAGSYTVTVTDANGCTGTASITITQPAQVTASITASTNVSCNGGSNGSATVTPGGGTPGFTYAWSPSGGTAATATGLAAGTYTVVVTDANSCSTSTSVTISQPTTLLAGASQNTPPSRNGFGISCFGGNDGSATAAAFGGTPGYTYLWSNSETTVVAMMLSAGLATVTVTDANGCSTTASVTMTQPPSAVSFSSATFTSPNCAVGQGTSNNGSITVTATGGISPYTFLSTPFATQGSSGVFSGLTAGTYTITVTDANSCTATTSITVTPLATVAVTPTAVPNPICSGTSTTLGASATGGTITGYGWSVTASTGNAATVTPAVANTASFSPTITQIANAVGISTKTFTVTATNINGCSASSSVVVTINPLPFLTGVTSPDPICSDAGAFNFTFTTNNNGANSLTIGNPSPSLSGFPQTLAFTSSPVGVVLPSPLTSNSYNLSYLVQNTSTGCASYASLGDMGVPVVVVNVRPRPVATVLAITGPTELCDAVPTSTLQVTTTGPNNTVVGAYPRSVLIQGPAGQFTITIPGTSDAAGTSSGTAAITVAGVYTVIGITDGTSCAGTITSSSTTLRDGRFTVTPSANSNRTGYVGCSVSMMANEVFTTPAFSNGTLTRQWQFKTSTVAPYSDLIGETGATLTLTNLMLSQSGYIYRMKVIGTGACGGVDKYSGEVTLSVLPFTVSAGSNQTQAAATFNITGTPSVALTSGTWSVVSGLATIANTNSASTTVTLIPNSTATLRWSIVAGSCSGTADVVLTRQNIILDAKAFLEGPLSGGAMSINIRSILPATSPYGTGESSVVIPVISVTDWIKVELRNAATPATLVEARSGLLMSNGKIVDMDGVSPITFNTASAGSYHIAVIHRNHIDFRTNTALSFAVGTPTVVDFTIAAPNVFNTALKLIGGTTSAMYAGDADGNNRVNLFDYLLWFSKNNTLSYPYSILSNSAANADFNLNPGVNLFDYLKWFSNNNINKSPNP